MDVARPGLEREVVDARQHRFRRALVRVPVLYDEVMSQVFGAHHALRGERRARYGEESFATGNI